MKQDKFFSNTNEMRNIKEILPDGTTKQTAIKDCLYGFNDNELNCSIGELSLIVRSSFNPQFDLAYIKVAQNYTKIGLLSELRPTLTNIIF